MSAHPTAAGDALQPCSVTYIEAIRAALHDVIVDDPRVFLLGEDIGHFGGPFGRVGRTRRAH